MNIWALSGETRLIFDGGYPACAFNACPFNALTRLQFNAAKASTIPEGASRGGILGRNRPWFFPRIYLLWGALMKISRFDGSSQHPLQTTISTRPGFLTYG
jgi:hypothetical protein